MVFVVAASFAPAPVPAAEPTGDQIVSLVIDAARNREREDVGTFSRRATTVRMLDPDAVFKPPGQIKRNTNKLGFEYIEHCDSARDPK